MRRLFVFWACVFLAACSTGRNGPPAAVDGQGASMNAIEVVPDEGRPRSYESPPPPPPPPPAPERDGFEGSSLEPAAGAPAPVRTNPSARVAGSSIRVPSTDTIAEMSALPPPPATDTSADPQGPIEQGLGAFVRPPDLMRPKTWYRIDFVAAADAKALKAEAGEETTEATEINIAPVMRVTLVEDENFKLKALTRDIQKLAGDKAATWAWNVMPLRPGTFTLEARVEVFQDGEVAYDYTRKVAVRVKVTGWQAFLAGITSATSLGEAMQALFKSWQAALVAFLAFLGVLMTVLWKLGIVKKKPEPIDPPSSS